ncbi:MAG: phosphate ABC transporter substrate-binding protein [Acidobacteriia bacterium]|nr:phosphate ABC transporter substrate-binding protein [Terriglobia bacterium]
MKKVRAGWSLVVGLVLFVAGCGSGSETSIASKSITIKGSNTMVVLAQPWAETYMKENPAITIQVSGEGTGTGIAALINGGTNICEASRPMKDVEKQQVLARHGKDAKEIAVAMDGIAICVHESNPVKSLSEPQLKGIYTGRITNWRDVGGKDQKIVAYSRDNSSGTYQFFKEHVLGSEDFARDVQTLTGTGAIISAVSKDPASIGYSGIGYASGIRVIPISRDDKSPAVAPSLETVKSSQYPLSRNLLFYTIGEPEGEVKTFIDWVLGPEGQKICATVGYYPIAKQ